LPDGSGNGDALLLAAGELGGAVVEAVANANRVDQPIQPLAVGLAPGDRQRQQDVLLGAQYRQQVEGLEDEPDLVAAQLRELAVVEIAQLDAVDRDRSRGREVKPCERVHQGGLAGPGRSHDRGEATAREADTDVHKRVHGGLAGAVAATDVPSLDDVGRPAIDVRGAHSASVVVACDARPGL
jgi:hypothetical protein